MMKYLVTVLLLNALFISAAHSRNCVQAVHNKHCSSSSGNSALQSQTTTATGAAGQTPDQAQTNSHLGSGTQTQQPVAKISPVAPLLPVMNVPPRITVVTPPLLPNETPMLVPAKPVMNVPPQAAVVTPPLLPNETPMLVPAKPVMNVPPQAAVVTPPLLPNETPMLVPTKPVMNVPPKMTVAVPSKLPYNVPLAIPLQPVINVPPQAVVVTPLLLPNETPMLVPTKPVMNVPPQAAVVTPPLLPNETPVLITHASSTNFHPNILLQQSLLQGGLVLKTLEPHISGLPVLVYTDKGVHNTTYGKSASTATKGFHLTVVGGVKEATFVDVTPLPIAANSDDIIFNFSFASAEIHKDQLSQIDKVIAKHSKNGKRIILMGETDGFGSEAYNKHLALLRAHKIINELKKRDAKVDDIEIRILVRCCRKGHPTKETLTETVTQRITWVHFQ